MLQQRRQQLIESETESEAVAQEQIAELFQSCKGQKVRLLPAVDSGNASLMLQRLTPASPALH
jgi:hypothetical protein